MAKLLKEAKRLYDLGWAVHWILPNSKAPVKAKWSGPVRDDWKTLKAEYRPAYGLGVRMGEASKVGSGYLANIDIDVKSSDPKHRAEALKTLERLCPKVFGKAPIVKTGYGLRAFVVTPEPMRSRELAKSDDLVSVHMPGSEVSKQQLQYESDGLITKEELDAGMRIRSAWQLELMSAGKQVVLPPSIHPDTKKPYIWEKEGDLIPVLKLEGGTREKESSAGAVSIDINFDSVDLLSSSLSDETYEQIVNGTGVTDRSAACFSAAMAMLRAGFSDDQILSVLTDRDNYLGDTGYEHAKTKSRKRAAAWIRDYSLKNAKAETAHSSVFLDEPSEPTRIESEEEKKKQTDSLSGKNFSDNWQFNLDHYPDAKDGTKGGIRPSQKNIVTILENSLGKNVFKLDMFRNRYFYSCDVPWTKDAKNRAVEDNDTIYIIQWLAEKYGFEPPEKRVINAIVVIASRNAFHPIRDELNNLPPWDGKERLNTALKVYAKCIGEGPDADEYLAQAFRKWMVASVKRTFEPGAKFDWMIILEGKQGIGKTEFFKILFGRKYHADWMPNIKEKDAALQIEGLRVFEFGELDQLHKSEVNTMKAFVTREVDLLRPPFGKLKIEIERQCIFAGTTNTDRYLKDETGNRRFVPLYSKGFRFSKLDKDRDQLWAEAMFIYMNGLENHLYIDGNALKYQLTIHSDKMVIDPSYFMQNYLEEFFKKEENLHYTAGVKPTRFSMHSLFSEGSQGPGPLQKYPQDNTFSKYAAKALRNLGFENVKSSGIMLWGFQTEESLKGDK